MIYLRIQVLIFFFFLKLCAKPNSGEHSTHTDGVYITRWEGKRKIHKMHPELISKSQFSTQALRALFLHPLLIEIDFKTLMNGDIIEKVVSFFQTRVKPRKKY